MKLWGLGERVFFQMMHDVRDMYRDCLACGYDDAKAERAVREYWVPQVRDTEEESVFGLRWLSQNINMEDYQMKQNRRHFA
ncbi:MAG: hypothetical protein V8Q79_07270 [Christensenellales bacterium]